MRKVAAMVIGLVVCAALPAAAQTRAGSFEFGAFAGWEFFEGEGIEDGLVYGARAGWNITDGFGLEAYYDVAEPDFELQFDDDDGEPEIQRGSLEGATYGLNLVFNAGGPGRVGVPYFLIGAGKGADDFEDLEFAEIGVGYRHFFSPVWALRGDLRALATDDEGGIGTDNFDVKATLGVSVVVGP